MRITAFFLLVGSLTVSAHGRAQDRVTLHLKQVTLEKVLDAIQVQTGYNYIFSDKEVRITRKFDVDVKAATIQEVLDSCLRGLSVGYEITGKMIKIVNKPKEVNVEDKNGWLGQGPNDLILYVVAEDGTRLAGATVKIKALNVEGVTNQGGEFELKKVPAGRYMVEVTYVGYERKEEEVEVKEQRKVATVGLKQALTHLDQVQIIAYGQTTQRLSTGDQTTVKSEDIEKQPVTNVLAAIEGRVPGLLISQQSGMAGASYSVTIRGQNSIFNGNDPLYVVDGVPYTSELITNSTLNPWYGNPLEFINPSDIESVTVLKDADATAIYGSRAANGAILITTKKGKAGRLRFNLDASEGVATAPMRAKWLNTPEYLQMLNEAFKNDGLTPDSSSAPDLLVYDTTRYTNWEKYLIGGSANYSNIAADLSGGSTTTQYLFGANYHDESTVFPAPYNDQKVALHFNLGSISNDQRFKLNLTANYLVNDRNLPYIDMSSFANTSPDGPPLYNPDGSLNWANSTWTNPIAYTRAKYLATTNNLIGNALISYNLLKGLYFKSSLGYTNLQVNEKLFVPIDAQDPAYSPTGSASFSDNNIQSWIIEPQMSYYCLLGKGRIEALGGSTFHESTTNGEEQTGSGYTSDALIQSIQAAPNPRVASLTNAVYKYSALFGRLTYNYGEKYLFNVNWRRDGSSRFGPDEQFHGFASVGTGWIFTKEDFLEPVRHVLSFGKLRASYGTTGNDQIGDYAFYNLFQSSHYPYQGTSTLTPSGLYNPQLAWELTKKLEGGLELGFASDRVLVQASYFSHRSSNQLLNTPLPSITGFTSIKMNLPASVMNSGWEFSLNSTNVESRKFKWKMSVNLTVGKNKLVSFPGLANNPSYNYTYAIGRPITDVQVFHSLGVDAQSGIYVFSDSSGKSTFNPSFSTDRTAFINLAPKFYGGMINTFIYDHWELDVAVQFRKQIGSNPLFQSNVAPGYVGVNCLQGVMKRWRNPGDKAEVEQFTSSFGSAAENAYSYATTSDLAYTDASFIRFSNMSLSYVVSSEWLRKVGMESLRVYVHAQNLWTITKYQGMDPEAQSGTYLPLLRVVTCGVRISL